MRVAEICPTCATYINATCIIYNGDYLSNIGAEPLMSLDEILGGINDTFPIVTGAGNPSVAPVFVGQYYLNTTNSQLWIGLGTSSVHWGLVGTLTTTTTTTTTSSTTTTTTTAP